MKKNIFVLIFIGLILLVLKFYPVAGSKKTTDQNGRDEFVSESTELSSLSIKFLRETKTPGSEIKIEEQLSDEFNYHQYLVTYMSEGNKIYALMTVPSGDKPKYGWPVIIFNHGYIPPKEYRTTERYEDYVDGFARNGYIVFKPDYRGHGNSEGSAVGAYGSPGYTIDVLNALASIKKFKDVDVKKIGMWGHSMGGHITLRSMVVNKDIKVGVIWGGVVASYSDIVYNWRRSNFTPPPLPSGVRRWRDILIETHGKPEDNSGFWNSISANSYLKDISGPLQLHHSVDDESVPVEFSEKLEKQMKKAGQKVELYTYENDNHNISNNFNTAMTRSVGFFDKYLK